ncbi:battenin-like [Acanthaster planci]|uniref:Battenin n=1 Tax=Acanthaster planci TaxID=133434 RepID=A0A8B7ZPK7_ACAPL|nr:battenin-like [Acanthaster planci]
MNMDDTVDQSPSLAEKGCKRALVRNLIAFWLLGLCNNYSFYVMLSAAYDILKKQPDATNVDPPDMFNLTNSTEVSRFDCSSVSTGAVLLADILPQLVIDVAAPWFADYIPYGLRVAICVATAASSFLLVALIGARMVAIGLIGVVLAGISAGLGEFTYLSFMAFHDKNSVSTWSSGTGASGLVSSLTYAGLAEVLGPEKSLLVMVVVPAITIVSYWGVLVRVPIKRPIVHDDNLNHEERQRLVGNGSVESADQEVGISKRQHLTLAERRHHLKYLLKYIIPLMLVYVAQYFTNQGLLELIYFKGTWMSHDSQYRWLQVLFRLGMFFSRSSVNIVRFKRLWIFSILQWCVLVLVFTEVYFTYMPSIAIIFAIIFCEGLIGGSAYVNTFHQIRVKERLKYKEFAMGATILASAIGTSLAGVLALPAHDALCQP